MRERVVNEIDLTIENQQIQLFSLWNSSIIIPEEHQKME